ncbi:MAG TPA: SAV_915 family protein [Kribbella sp.]
MDDPVPLYVPTRTAGARDVAAPQVGRRPDGVRVGIAFSSLELLRAASGPRQDWMRLHEDNLRELLVALGVSVIQLDPVLVGPDVGVPAPELVGSHGR